MSFDDDLKAANADLKSLRSGVAIRRRGDRLSLRANLPPKPDSDRAEDFQQDVSLGIYANPAGLRQAIAQAKKMSSDVALGSFDWKEWGWSRAEDKYTVAHWIEAFERHYFTDRVRDGKSETTWVKDYMQPFNKLPQDVPLTADIMLEVIRAKEPNSRPRKRFCGAYAALAKLAGIPLDVSALRGNYSPSKVNPRDLPTDEVIREWRDRIPRPDWQWVYGCVAAFGLRDHEVFYIDLKTIKESPLIWVTDGKTGAHYAMACPVQWWQEWRLYEPKLPPVTARRNEDYTHRCGIAFGRDLERSIGERLPFGLQDLRHCWSVRSSLMGIPSEFAARLQGHSHKMHTDTYQRHMDEVAFQAILKTLQEDV
jgi:integrase